MCSQKWDIYSTCGKLRFCFRGLYQDRRRIDIFMSKPNHITKSGWNVCQQCKVMIMSRLDEMIGCSSKNKELSRDDDFGTKRNE